MPSPGQPIDWSAREAEVGELPVRVFDRPIAPTAHLTEELLENFVRAATAVLSTPESQALAGVHLALVTALKRVDDLWLYALPGGFDAQAGPRAKDEARVEGVAERRTGSRFLRSLERRQGPEG